MTQTEPKLAIMFCPYCGSTDVHELHVIDLPFNEGPNEILGITCIGCTESCVIERAVEPCDEADDVTA